MSEGADDEFYAALADDDPAALYEQAPSGYLSTSPEGLIIKVNETFLALTGYARDDLVGRRRFSDLLTVGGRIYHETHYAPMLQLQGTVREIALDLVRADGSRVPVLVNSVVDKAEDGAPRVIRTAVTDATERREYERELLRAKERAEASEERAMLLVQTLQQTLIPPSPPEIPGLEIATAYRPAGDGEEVGGDFYDVFAIGPGDWVVAIGDVCGKGVQAAVVTALARHTIRAASVQESEPSAILTVLNTVLVNHGPERSSTVALLRLRESGGAWTVTVSSGGHPLPLLLRPEEPPVETGKPGTLLGLLDGVKLHDTTFPLAPGDVVLLYTDGVSEARRGAAFFEDTLLEAVQRHRSSARNLVDGLLGEVLSFQSGRPRDDIALVAISRP